MINRTETAYPRHYTSLKAFEDGGSDLELSLESAG